LRTSNGLPPLCTVGAAELAPPASGRIALFSTAMVFEVFSSPLPEVAVDDVVVQLVSGFAPDDAAVCANAAPAIKEVATANATIREITIVSCKGTCRVHRQNVTSAGWFHSECRRPPHRSNGQDGIKYYLTRANSA